MLGLENNYEIFSNYSLLGFPSIEVYLIGLSIGGDVVIFFF